MKADLWPSVLTLSSFIADEQVPVPPTLRKQNQRKLLEKPRQEYFFFFWAKYHFLERKGTEEKKDKVGENALHLLSKVCPT